MKKSLFGLVAIGALIAGPAMAADMGMPMKAPPAPAAPAVSWTGCYIDGGGGYGLWNQEHTTTTTFGALGFLQTVNQTDGGNGWLGRVGAGCDYQFGSRWVVGVFGDYDFMDLKGTNSPLEVQGLGAGGTAPFFPINAVEKESAAWSVGPRLGYLVAPSVLTYVDGGYTQARFDAQSEVTNLGVPIGFGFPAHTYSGWFVGGGVETSISAYLPGLPSGLFLRTEYRFSEYQRTNLPEINQATGAPDLNFESTRPMVQTVVTSLVWRFNWGGPLATRY